MTEDELILEEHKHNKALEETERMFESYLYRLSIINRRCNEEGSQSFGGPLQIKDGKLVLKEPFPTEAELVALLERRERGKKYGAYLRDQKFKLKK